MKVFDVNYKVKYIENSNDEFLDKYGDIDFNDKIIRVVNNRYKEETLIHELVHAMLWEMALEEQAQDENIVNIITKIVIKIKRLLK